MDPAIKSFSEQHNIDAWVNTADAMSTLFFQTDTLIQGLKQLYQLGYTMLFDLSASHVVDNPEEFEIIYHLLDINSCHFLRVKTRVAATQARLPSVIPIWPNANWYERELYDMFGIHIDDHPNLKRILMPEYWQGHPLRKDHAGRATDLPDYELPEEKYRLLLESYRIADSQEIDEQGRMILNIGPNHPGTHGLLRLVAELDGEIIQSIEPDIGFHHRGAEKMGELQNYHTYIPYTDRIDYLAGVQNELPYVLAVEQLAGITVPARAQCIRILLCELFRLASHMVWIGSMAHDVGAMAPAFYAFRDREHLFDLVESFTGGRMHPAFFRIGGVAADLPKGWRQQLHEFLQFMPHRIKEYEALTVDNAIFKKRTQGIGKFTLEQAISWGFSGPNLRATGPAFDLRKRQPYSGYEHYEFSVPVATEGDAYARSWVRLQEMYQSLGIVVQTAAEMPAGEILDLQSPYSFPSKHHTLNDIETLIHHFIGVSRGRDMPKGETFFVTEAPKGMNAYYIVSDGTADPYRLRIRTPSFTHLQALTVMAKDHFIADTVCILGSLDYVLADVDR